ncbi:MAG: M24 family metallopeptidase, partial [Micrococcales bacterium]
MPRDSQTGFLTPGVVSPLRSVPGTIARPEYVGKKGPAKYTAGDIYSPDEVELIRESGRIAAQAIAEVGKHCIPGVTTDELDRIGHEFVLDHGAYPSALGYRGFPKSICTSLNEVICHGIP